MGPLYAESPYLFHPHELEKKWDETRQSENIFPFAYANANINWILCIQKSFRLLHTLWLSAAARTNKKLCVAPAATERPYRSTPPPLLRPSPSEYVFIGDVPAPPVANSWNVHSCCIESARHALLHAFGLVSADWVCFNLQRERWPAVYMAEWRQSIFIDSKKSHLLFMGPRTLSLRQNAPLFLLLQPRSRRINFHRRLPSDCDTPECALSVLFPRA